VAAEPRVPVEPPTIVLGEPPGGGNAAAPGLGVGDAGVRVGDLLADRYRLLELIGEGGMSRVYKAIDLQRAGRAPAGECIAVKVLARPFDGNPASLVTLEDDVRKLRALEHPNIVRLFGCERDGATLFITMEYLVGRSLYARLHSRAIIGGTPPGIDRDDALSIIIAVAGALGYAHQLGIVHGDLKPGNVILTSAGAIKIIDFGMANLTSRPRTARERREVARRRPSSALTPRYASPQQMARNPPQTTDDIYALACLAYELLTGIHPFDDGSGTPTTTFPPPLRPGLTPAQHAAITHGLQLERRDRTPTVRQFMDEFAEPAARSPGNLRVTGRVAALLGIVSLAGLAAWLGGASWLGSTAWFGGKAWLDGRTWLARHATATPKTPAPPLAARPSAAAPADAPAPGSPAATSSTASISPPSPAATPPPAGTMLRDCPTCPQMTVLPTGSFQQGADDSPTATRFEKPRHAVAIAYTLAMANRDVTVGDFREFVAATQRDMQGCDVYDGQWRHKNKASWAEPGFEQSDAHPVTCTSWNDAVAYAKWLSAKTGHRYRLPSASEWEYAARAGATAALPWGSNPSAACDNANVADQSAARRYPGWDVFTCDDGYVNTAPVSTYKPNAFGLDDMLGNVFQWTLDCWRADYTGAPNDGAPRQDGDCTQRELRGGSWFSEPDYVRPAYRNHFAADYRTSSVGFRLVRETTP